MADVFISYKREDQMYASALDVFLKNLGLTVWWDTSLTAGDYFDERLGREIEAARAVVVLWSEKSAGSRWVRAEALSAFGRGVLVSARIDDVSLGFPFSSVQTADLRGWNLRSVHPGLQDVKEGIDLKLKDTSHPTRSEEVKATESAPEYSWKTGLDDLDRAIGGLGAGTLTVIASRPSMGKSALATRIAFNIAMEMTRRQAECAAFYFSLEASTDDLGAHLLALAGDVSAHRLRTGKISKSEYERLADTAIALNGLPLHIDDAGRRSAQDIEIAVSDTAHHLPPGLIIVDRFSMIGATTFGARSARENATRLKVLARELRAPVVVTTEVESIVETRDDRRPTLADIDDSLQDLADCVLGVYRERLYLEREEPRLGTDDHLLWQNKMEQNLHSAELLVLKHRGGPLGRVNVFFDNDTMSFANIAR